MLLYFGIFVRYFLWLGGGGVYMVPLAYDNGMVHAIAAGIPAPSDTIDVCVSKHQSALIGGDGDSSSTAGPKAQGPRPPNR